jgi:predicted permease
MEAMIMEMFWRDMKFAVRTLRRSPGFTIVAILTLALGIGANTAIFSVVNGVVLAALPYHQPDQLVLVWARNPAGRFISPSYPDVKDWQEGSHSFQAIAALTGHAYDLTHPGTPEHLAGWEISSGFFKTLGVNLVLGRDFSAEENRAGGAAVAIISERVWRRQFGGSAAVLGKTAVMDGVDYTIVGVAPPGISLGGDIDVYTPIEQGDPLIVNDRRTHAFLAIGRLNPGTTMAQAEADVAIVQKRTGELYPKLEHGLSAGVQPLKAALVGDVSGMLLVLFGAVGLVLLIACANVASLLLARAVGRAREFAIRTALGAPRARIVGQMVAESVLLSLCGGALGLLIAKLTVKPLIAAIPGDFPRAENVGLDARVLLFTFAVSVLVGTVFGLLPALKTIRAKQQPSLKEGGRGSTTVHHRAQRSLVVVQTALTLVLLAGAGLLFRTIRHLSSVNPGFDAQQLISFKAGLAPEIARSPQATRAAYQQLLERIEQISGVQAADLTTLLPLSGNDNEVPFWLGPDEPSSVAEAPRLVLYSVGPDYFRTMGVPLLEGRALTLADTLQTERVILIDSEMAKKYFPGKDPVGQTLSMARVGRFRIIGVVGHVKHWGLGDTSNRNQVEGYTSFYQISDEWLPVMRQEVNLLVRTRLDSAALLPAVRAAIYGSGSQQPIYDVHTMREEVSASMATQSFPMVLLGAFAALALLLATVGTYGLLANFVQRRTQEIGVRMALGAQQSDVFRMIIGQGLRLAAIGIAIGLAGAFILPRVLLSFSHLLYGVGANDPVTLAIACFTLTATTTLACYIPARRAMKVAPTEALREE